MNKTVYLFISFFFSLSFATDDLEVLMVPSSPAMSIIGLGTSSIEKITVPTNFKFSALEKTDALKILPSNGAISITPFWLFENDMKYDVYLDNSFGFLQTLTFSSAFSNDIETNTNIFSLGLNSSIVQGIVDRKYKSFGDSLNLIYKSLDKTNEAYGTQRNQFIENDPIVINIKKKLNESTTENETVLENNLFDRRTELMYTFDKEFKRENLDEIHNIENQVTKLYLRRTGFKLDVASALAFIEATSGSTNVSKVGAWVTLSRDFPDPPHDLTGADSLERYNNFEILLLARYINDKTDTYIKNDGSISENIDTGLRFGLVSYDKIISLSTEGLFRRDIINNKSDWRAAGIVTFPIAKNTVINYTFARDFSNSKMSIISLSYGLGSKREVLPKYKIE